nr:PREDICTED: resistin [Equus przewalskii]
MNWGAILTQGHYFGYVCILHPYRQIIPQVPPPGPVPASMWESTALERRDCSREGGRLPTRGPLKSAPRASAWPQVLATDLLAKTGSLTSRGLKEGDVARAGSSCPRFGLLSPPRGPCRMKALSVLLLPALGLLVCGETLCPVDEAINAKIGTGITSLILGVIRQVNLDCRSISNRGDLATCPRGFAVTGCTCGSACGSWDGILKK